jgi:Lamin Tail Domain/Bacterial Ig domain/Secretion system C-terminal sorting domain
MTAFCTRIRNKIFFDPECARSRDAAFPYLYSWPLAKNFVILRDNFVFHHSHFFNRFIMKKRFLSLIVAILTLATAQSQIVITEIMYNPPESGVDSLEFIEVLNTSNGTVDMTGWTLEFGTFSSILPSLTVAAGQYQLFSVNAAAIQNNFGKASVQWTSGALSNNGTSIRIKNTALAMIDSVSFDDQAPWPTGPDGTGSSLVLCDPSTDNNLGENWSEATTETSVVIGVSIVYANPGAVSGCVSGLVAEEDNLAVTPGQGNVLTVLSNDNVPNPVTSFTVISAPQHGTAVPQPDNTILYTPAAGYCGPDQFIYQVCDGPVSCSSATVNIDVKCYPVRTIAQMNNINPIGIPDSLNVSCELTGTVYGVNIRASGGGLQFVIMNDNGTEGISTFRGTGTFGYDVKEGDKVTVRGTIAFFSGLTQINLDTVFKVSANNPLVAATVVPTVAESTENLLVRINNLRYVDIAQWTPGVGSGFTVRVYSPSNPADTIQMRIDNDIDLFNTATPPAEPFDVIGLGGQFDGSAPYTTGYQLLPRYTADIVTMVGTTLVDYKNEVKLAPNPVKDILTITTAVTFDRVSLVNPNGQVVKTIQNPSTQTELNMSAMPGGVYVLRFEKAGSIWATPVVKM